MKRVRIDMPDDIYYGIMNISDEHAKYVVSSRRGVILKDLGNYKNRKGKKPLKHEPREKKFLIEQRFDNLIKEVKEFSKELENFVEKIEGMKKRLIEELKK